MKLRIKDNSIRLRLTNGEVETAGKTGRVAGQTSFPGGQTLQYVLAGYDSDLPVAHFENNTITVCFPMAQLNQWANTERVGMEHRDDQMHLLVEKDFTCLTARPEEQNGDYFPNPLQTP